MSAGKGVLHSEFNGSKEQVVHFLQIWIQPSQAGIKPSYEQKYVASGEKRGRLRVVASPDGRDGSVTVHQDACLYAGLFDGAERASHPLAAGRRAYVHVARGKIDVNGQRLEAGDAAKLADAPEVVLENGREAEVLLFDLA
jgi:hypothetical protein